MLKNYMFERERERKRGNATGKEGEGYRTRDKNEWKN